MVEYKYLTWKIKGPYVWSTHKDVNKGFTVQTSDAEEAE